MTLLAGCGVSTDRALCGATSLGGELFGGGDAGLLGSGDTADLVVLDRDPRDSIRHTQRIRAVMVRGEYVQLRDTDDSSHPRRAAVGSRGAFAP